MATMLMEEMDDYKQPNGLPHAECRVTAGTSDNREPVLEVRAESWAGEIWLCKPVTRTFT